jgi:serine/threonine protein kinase
MNSQSTFGNIYQVEIEDDESKGDYHQLDEQPKSFLHQMNGGDMPLNSEIQCKLDENNNIVIPEIPQRCFMKWDVGEKLAKGRGAVVFSVDCKDRKCIRVARVTQLRNQKDCHNFKRDIEARYLLSCRCKNVSLTSLTDAFICETSTGRFGVTISDMFDGSPIRYLMTISQPQRRLQFLSELETSLTRIVKAMHTCGIVHRDLHEGNILVRKTTSGKMEFALTDFESAGGKYFKTSERVISAYIHSDTSAVQAIVAELDTVNQYLNGKLRVIDDNLLEDLDITLTSLNNLKLA